MDGVPDIVDVVLWFLGVLSVLVWAIAIFKGIVFFKESSQNKAFIRRFSQLKHLGHVSDFSDTAKGGLARLCQVGLGELRDIENIRLSPEKQQLTILHTLRTQAHVERTRLENGLGVLASIGSTAPFIGLFGTVWGIMHALKNISATGSAGLDVVAGPIGEALIATAIGIATAVPAVLAYNYFLRQIKLRNAEMENFASAFQYLLIKSGLGGV